MKTLFLLGVVFFGYVAHSQETKAIALIQAPKQYDNIHVERIFGDSLSTSFMIWIKDTVATHKHEVHNETIHVLEGKAKFYFNDNITVIKAGEVLFIPKNNWHAVKVTSRKPLKVISTQSPGFYGKDRVFRDVTR